MKYPILITGDWHLTDKKDEKYRWEFLDCLLNQSIGTLICTGDLTEKKNHHSERVVNGIYNFFKTIEAYCYIVCGNHDYINENSNEVFFDFLNGLDNVHIMGERVERGDWVFVPNHSKLIKQDLTFNYIVMHHDIQKAIFENGYVSKEGINERALKHFKGKKIFNGHIHVPQQIGKITCVGSPYPVKFSKSSFDYRCISISEDGEGPDLGFYYKKRLKLNVDTVEDLKNKELEEDDTLKIGINLKRSEAHKYSSLRDEIVEYCNEECIILNEIKSNMIDDVELKSDGESQPIKSHSDWFAEFLNNNDLDQNCIDMGKNILQGCLDEKGVK